MELSAELRSWGNNFPCYEDLKCFLHLLFEFVNSNTTMFLQFEIQVGSSPMIN